MDTVDKETLRKAVLDKRRSLSPLQVSQLSNWIQMHLIGSAAFERSDVIALYSGFGNEVGTDEIFAEIIKSGKTAVYPRLRNKSLEMDFRVLSRLDKMTPHKFGMLEPPEENEIARLETIDLVLVPGLAFDDRGGRLGFGGGCYDRILPKMRTETVKIGLAYQIQIVGQVPLGEHDVLMDRIITEHGFLSLKK